MAQNASVDVHGCKVNVRRAGDGPPLLFLHGVQGLRPQERVIDALAEHFEVIAPDHPGFGWSENADLVEDIQDLALFYLDVLDALKLDQVHVVGHCIGGWAALELAVRSAGRFKSMVLLNSAGLRLKGVPRADMFLCSEDDLLKLLFAKAGGSDWLHTWRATADLEDVYDRNRAAGAKFSWSPRLCNPKLDRWLHRIKVPTHIVWAQEDGVIPPAYAEALNTLIPSSTLSAVPDCAHLAHIEQPQRVADEVTQFVDKVAS
ncbi:MAG: alpha/beta fold hydrolase [Xanthobacteraceae bacterium]